MCASNHYGSGDYDQTFLACGSRYSAWILACKSKFYPTKSFLRCKSFRRYPGAVTGRAEQGRANKGIPGNDLKQVYKENKSQSSGQFEGVINPTQYP